MQLQPDDQYRRAVALRDLHAGPGTFVIPNPWDAGSARILAGLGFRALATTSAGLAFGLGRPDGLNRLRRPEVLDNARAIVSATDLPVSRRPGERLRRHGGAGCRDDPAGRRGRAGRRVGRGHHR